MIAFTSLLWVWRTDRAGRWFFLTVPEAQAGPIKAQAMALPKGFGSVRVEAKIGTVSWRTSVFPQESGAYLLPVKADVRKRARLNVGDEVWVELELL